MDKPLKYYDVKIEVLVPATIVHQILAESPEEALEKAEKSEQPIKDIRYQLVKRKKLSIAVYDSGTHTLHLRKQT